MPRRFVLLIVFVMLVVPAAHAQDSVPANWPNLVRTLVRFKAIDLSDPVIIDEYSVITECDLYKAFYHDDFKWNQVRQAVRQSVSGHIATFPTAYHYDTKLQLDRYDFAAQVFRFTNKSTINNVNSLALYAVDGTDCGGADIKNMPRVFKAVIPTPLYMDGIPLSEGDGHALIKQMDADQNSDRLVYARFNMHIVYIEPLRKNIIKGQDAVLESYGQSKEGDTRNVRFDAQIDSIEFYEDPQMRRLIYRYQL